MTLLRAVSCPDPIRDREDQYRICSTCPQSALTKKQSSETSKSKTPSHKTLKKQTQAQEAKNLAPHTQLRQAQLLVRPTCQASTQRPGDSAFPASGCPEPCTQLPIFSPRVVLVPRGALHSSVPGPAEPGVSQRKDFSFPNPAWGLPGGYKSWACRLYEDRGRI